MRIFADTSGLFALIDSRDHRHAEAAERFREFRSHRAELVTHNYVVVELAALVHRRLGKIAAIRVMDDVLAPLEKRWVTPGLHAEAMAAFRATTRSDSSFVDEVSFAVMRSEQLMTAFAFDDDFRRAGFETVP